MVSKNLSLKPLVLGNNEAKNIYPPASEVSREVANLTERKYPHTPIYGVKEFVSKTSGPWQQ